MSRKSSRTSRIGIGLAAAVSLTVAGQAQETEERVQLEDVVVTATRSAVSTKQLPANVTVITAEDIARGNYSDVVSVLERRAGIHFRSFSGYQEAAVDIRGFGENSHGRVLVLRDGRKLNRPDSRSINWNQIPLANVERIEVVRGPNGAVYGDHAVGGVINIITKKGSERPTSELRVEAGTENFNRQVLSTAGNLGDLDYALSFERGESAGWRDRSGTRTEGGDVSLGYSFGPGLRLDVNLDALHTEYEMPGGLFKAAYEADPAQAGNPADEAIEEYFAISPRLSARVGDHGEFVLDLGFMRKDIEADLPSYFVPQYTDLEIDTLSVSPRYVHTAPVGELPNRLTIGLDWTDDSVDLERYDSRARTNGIGGAEVTKDTLAVYVNDALNLTDAVTASVGARWARSTFAAEERNAAGATVIDDDAAHREKAYHLGLTWNATETTKLFLKYEHFFRFPFTDEQISYSGYGSGFSKDLYPETGDSYEAGIEQQLPGNLTLAGTLFHMEMEDEIAWDGANFRNANLGETIHQGLELAASVDPWSFLSFYGNYTLLGAEFDAGPNNGNRIPLVPKHKVAVGAEFRPLDVLRVHVDARHTSSMREGGDDANALDKIEDYTVVDVGVAYSLDGRRTTWEIFAGVDNVFDERYSNLIFYGGHYAAPGRTYKIGAKVRF